MWQAKDERNEQAKTDEDTLQVPVPNDKHSLLTPFEDARFSVPLKDYRTNEANVKHFPDSQDADENLKELP
jgi:hypothetical protein